MQHSFFQSFGIPFQEESTQPIEKDIKYDTNCIIFEIVNNWPFVRWMMDRYRNGELKQIDPLEQVWYNFIMINSVDVEKYGGDSNKFLEEYIKK